MKAARRRKRAPICWSTWICPSLGESSRQRTVKSEIGRDDPQTKVRRKVLHMGIEGEGTCALVHRPQADRV